MSSSLGYSDGPTAKDLGEKMGQREVVLVGPLQRPPPKGKDDNNLSPRRGRGPSRMGGRAAASVGRGGSRGRPEQTGLLSPRGDPLSLQLGGGFLKNQRCPSQKIHVSLLPCLKF